MQLSRVDIHVVVGKDAFEIYAVDAHEDELHGFLHVVQFILYHLNGFDGLFLYLAVDIMNVLNLLHHCYKRI